jgi:hypothetical protein
MPDKPLALLYKPLALFCGVLALSILTCRTGDSEARQRVYQDLYPSPTSEATQTPLVRVITTTPLATQTPDVRVYTATPVPTTQAEVSWLCVTAVEAVYLRPSPSTENYPIVQLENGTRIVDLRGRDGSWWFVQSGNKQGWVKKEYVRNCD